MTREEELDWLCRLRSEIYVYMPKEWLIPMNNALDMVIKELEQEPKTGQWIERRNRATGRIESVCSECEAEEGYPYNIYCGNCGCRMFEPQEESEE